MSPFVIQESSKVETCRDSLQNTLRSDTWGKESLLQHYSTAETEYNKIVACNVGGFLVFLMYMLTKVSNQNAKVVFIKTAPSPRYNNEVKALKLGR